MLTDGPSGTLENVYVADGRTVRATSMIELDADGGAWVEGGRNPVFIDDNKVIFYADVDGSATIGTPLGLAEIPAAGLRIATIDPFGDVFGNTHAGAIWWAAGEGITQGCTDESFCPEAPLTRAQAASMLARALGLEPVADGAFADVSGVHAGAINALADAGITAGCADGLFCPHETLTRGQAASFLARALGLDSSVRRPLHRCHRRTCRSDQRARRSRDHGRVRPDELLPTRPGDPRPDGHIAVPGARGLTPPALLRRQGSAVGGGR